jgi:hypothetical protein
VIQLVLPHHECAAEPVQDVVEFVADPAATESATEPLHAVADLAIAGAVPTETSCLCVQI